MLESRGHIKASIYLDRLSLKLYLLSTYEIIKPRLPHTLEIACDGAKRLTVGRLAGDSQPIKGCLCNKGLGCGIRPSNFRSMP